MPDDFVASKHGDERFDIVVANILSSPLKLMAPMLSGRVAPGGSLILSGVLARQAEEVAAAYAPFIKLGVWAEQDGWVALHGQLGTDTAPPPRATARNRMALATQCPHCHTTFRVASDQLKLRGGIVRCGACQSIFDGNAHLIDLEQLAASKARRAASGARPPAPEPSCRTRRHARRHDLHAGSRESCPKRRIRAGAGQHCTPSTLTTPAPDHLLETSSHDSGSPRSAAPPTMPTLEATAETPIPKHRRTERIRYAPRGRIGPASTCRWTRSCVAQPLPDDEPTEHADQDDARSPPGPPSSAGDGGRHPARRPAPARFGRRQRHAWRRPRRRRAPPADAARAKHARGARRRSKLTPTKIERAEAARAGQHRCRRAGIRQAQPPAGTARAAPGAC